MSIEILSFGIGTLLAVIGLVVAYIQWKQAKDVERLRREQLRHRLAPQTLCRSRAPRAG
jgi:protein-S-isoprenylcysteine O-methyltransferase Ste14